MSREGDCGFTSPVTLEYQINTARICFFYEASMNCRKKRAALPFLYSGAFMLSTMLMRLTWRRMTRHTAKLNSMVSTTLSR